MFDLRYHVASLTAVFVALIIGILVGVGISGRGFVDEAEREKLTNRIGDLQVQLDASRQRADDLERQQNAASDLARESYPVLVGGRLADKRFAVVFVGSVSDTLGPVEQAIEDAGGTVARLRSIEVPFDQRRLQQVQAALARRQALARYAGEGNLGDLGRAVGRELARGGETPLLDALADAIIEQRTGDARIKVDGVVVIRSADPQRPPTAAFVRGLYAGLSRAGVPVVGVETADAQRTAIPAFARSRLSTVDDVDAPAGQLALVLLLAGAQRGHYGVSDTATDGILPPIESPSASG